MSISSYAAARKQWNMLRAAFYQSHRDNSPACIDLSWEDLVEALSSPTFTECHPCKGKDCWAKHGEAWSPVDIEGPRANANVRFITAAVLDLDDVTHAQLIDLAPRLEGGAYVIHSTHSNAPPNYRLRLVMALSRPVPAAQWRSVLKAIIVAFQLPIASERSGGVDPICKDLSRLYFLPTAPTGVEPFVECGYGMPLDVDRLLQIAHEIEGSQMVPQSVVASRPTELDVSTSGNPPGSDSSDLAELRQRPASQDIASDELLRTLPPCANDIHALWNRLIDVRARKASSTNSEDRERCLILDRVLQGTPLAQPGARDNTVNQAASLLAFAFPPRTPGAAAIEILRPSLLAMQTQSEGIDYWISRAIFSYERAMLRRLERDEKTEAANSRLLAGLRGRGAHAGIGDLLVRPYTEEEIAGFAARAHCTVAEFKDRWLIQKGDSFYIWRGETGYSPPLWKKELPAALQKRDLARVPLPADSPAGIQWKAEGGRLRTSDEIIRGYATVADKVVANMMLQESYYDANAKVFHEAVCRLRPIVALFDPQIDQWLRYLGGDQAEKLLDWIATLTRLDRVTCAVYLHGPKDAGKNMLVDGLAQLWGHAPTQLASLTGNFNSALTNSPLIFADEEIPKKMSSGFIRRLIGSSSRELTRKHIPEAELIGAVRLVIAANTDDLLRFDEEDFTEDDISAVATRILYIKPTPSERRGPDGRATTLAAEYLRSLGGRSGTEGWVENGAKIAAHALWLRDNRDVKPGSRFLVEGEKSSIHSRLATNGATRGLVIEWLAKALMFEHLPPLRLSGPSTGRNRNPAGLLFGGGKLFLNATYVQQTWAEVMDSKRPAPSLKRIGQALKVLAHGEKSFSYDRRVDLYDINVEVVLEAFGGLQVGAIDEYKKKINGPPTY